MLSTQLRLILVSSVVLQCIRHVSMLFLGIFTTLAIVCLVPHIAAFQDDPNCGTQRPGLGPGINIVGGKDAQAGEWPWQGLLYEDNTAWCGATLLTPEWAVTNGFCIDLPKYPSIYSVVLGLHNLTNTNTGNEQIVGVSEIFMHPNFVYGQNDWNIALLKLAEPANLTDYVRTVCVPTSAMESDLSPGTLTTITGWGQTRDGCKDCKEKAEYSVLLQEAEIPIIDKDVCINQFPIDYITDNMVCGGLPGGDIDSCAFDSGGPMVTKIDDRWYLSGIILSEFCAYNEDNSGVYTRVTAFEDWLAPIFEGNNPETTPECTYDEFTCPEGWCTDYCSKCDGNTDDCIYGGDESYCDGLLELFDPFPFVKVMDSFVKEELPVTMYSECAELCLDATYSCLAFDVKDEDGSLTCYLTESGYQIDENFGDFDIMHFEIEKMPLPSSTTKSLCGKIASPIWLLAYPSPDPLPSSFNWTLEPPPTGFNPGIMFNFTRILAGNTDCNFPSRTNTITFKSGVDSLPVFTDTICLSDLQDTVSYQGSSIVIEFDTVDAEGYGFVLEYTAVSECSVNLTESSGPVPANFTSPNYPEDYPDVSFCETRIQAPIGYNVLLTIFDFQIEDSVTCDFDTLSIYDGANAYEESLFGVYCGVSIPSYFLSSGQDLLVVFESDATTNYRGFKMQYEFVEDYTNCGIQKTGLDPEANIVGGKDAQAGEWPWQGLLYDDNEAWCGATLLTPEWAVTNGFCIDLPKYPSIYSVVLGLHNLTNTNTGNEQIVGVSEIFMHPNFTIGQDDWNIALLKLSKPAVISDYVRTVCVPTSDMASDLSPGTFTTITGWGQTENELRYSTILQEAQVPIVEQEVCSDQFPKDYITDNMMCAGLPGGGIDSCIYDSGGPMVANIADRWYLSGIILSEFCALNEDYSGVYTRVTAFEDWLAPIFERNDPETIPECTYEEFSCPEGWCSDYCSKCNGQLDGCVYGGDESYCDGLLELFDPYPFVKLTQSSIVEVIPVMNYSQCAELCLDAAYQCRAFDVKDDDGSMTCYLAVSEFLMEDNFGDLGVMHFEIEKMPLPSANIQAQCGKIASPNWLPAYRPPEPPVNTFIWTLEPPQPGINPGIMFDFVLVQTGDTDCSIPNKRNTVTFKSGPSSEPAFNETLCLSDLPSSVMYEGTSLVVEFNTADPELYGFILEFMAVSDCNNNFTDSSGPVPANFTSPNYPENYADYSFCETRIQAPIGYNVLLTMFDFQLEDSDTCEYDTLTVYNGAFADEKNLIGVYCGDSIPSYFVSSGQALLVVFRSDLSVSYRGFIAQYEFVEDGKNCGIQRPGLDPETNIVGGKDAQPGEWPWQGFLYEDNRVAYCGATLLTPEWAVTVGFCIDLPKYPSKYSVALGLHNLDNVDTGNEQLLGVSEIFMHPNYTFGENDWNIALLKLAQPAIISDYVRTVCIPTADMESDLAPGKLTTITGWGQTKQAEYSDILQEGDVPIVDQEVCRNQFPIDTITDNMICAGIPGGDVDTCSFDAGGPMVAKIDDRWYLSGVILSEFCARYDGYSGVYTRVTAFEDWLAPIFEGNDPETIPECTYDEFTCPEGWCADYCSKCNGEFDGCIYGGDESYCDGLLELFDPFPFMKLQESSIAEVVPVEEYSECAELCLDAAYNCRSFDVTEDAGNLTCSLGQSEFYVDENFGDLDVMHFEIEKLPLPSTTLQRSCGKIGSPIWLPAYQPPDPPATTFTWTLEPPPSGYKPGVLFNFTRIVAEDTDCDDPAKTNTLTFKSGPNSVPSWSETTCLNALPDSVTYEGISFVVEFDTIDADMYGFVLEYTAVSECSSNFTNSTGPVPANFTSPNYPENYPDDSLCETGIKAPFGYNVLLTILDFLMEDSVTCDYDTLSIYDGPVADETRLMGVYCGDSIPTYFTSSGQDLLVVFQSDFSVSYRGFMAQYEFVEENPCDNTFYDAPGSFTSPNYPQNYPDNTFCNTRITVDDGNRVLLVFRDISLEPDSSPGCFNDFDTVSIYDSSLANEEDRIAVLCGTGLSENAFVTTGQNMLVVFKSDSGVNNRGFDAVFYSVPDTSGCDDVFLIAPDTVSSPNYPEDYPDSSTCNSLIVAPIGSVVRLTILDFLIEGPGFDGCTFDSLSIYDSNIADENALIGSYCNDDIPEFFLSSNTSMLLVFESDASVNYRGFEALFEFVTGDDQGCDNTFTNSPGIFSSPNYPSDYPSGVLCRTLIIAPSDQIIRLKILDFQLEQDYSPDCGSDWDTLRIYDAGSAEEESLLGVFCGNSINGFFESSGSRMYLEFKSDPSVARRGFQAEYMFQNDTLLSTPPPPIGDTECGKQTFPLDPESNIVGGQPAQEAEWPWQAVLFTNDSSRNMEFRCGAAILTTEWVVTAAHCIDVLNDASIYKIVAGTNSVAQFSEYTQIRDLSAVYVHPNATRFGHDNDIALLNVALPFAITDHVRTACTAPKEWDYYFNEGVLCTVTGWGLNFEDGLSSSNLFEVEVPIYDQDSCRMAYQPEPITDNMICAGYTWGGRDACEGDDGGPLVSKARDQWYLVGVVSWGDGCARETKPRVYTRITAFEDWIAPIYDGGVPDSKEADTNCGYDEFQCSDGWCIDYSNKCDGDVNGPGCYNGEDETYCDDGNTLFFDTLPGLELTPSSVRETFDVGNVEECAQQCLSSVDPVCFAYDFFGVSPDGLCSLALPEYETRSRSSPTTMHFQIEKMPCPGDSITSATGRIATPKWLPGCSTLLAAGEYYWIIMPQTEEYLNAISITFSQIQNGDPSLDCSSPETNNGLIIRSGPDYQSPPVLQYCLNEVPQNILVRSLVARIDFFTVDSNQYGFLADFELVWTCDDVFTEAPGVFSTPNYPDSYPPNIECRTQITAPTDLQVLLFMRDFELESGGGPDCRFDWDTMTVYDGPAETSPLIGKYCGSEVPQYFRSTGESLLVVFKSDSSITLRGFEAAYYHVPANVTLPSGNSTDECGIQTVTLEPEVNIVGGKPAQEGEWPWQVAIYYFNSFICGGSLLTPEWVVTSANCIPDDSPNVYDIIIGSNNVDGASDNAQLFSALEVVIHPQFDFSSNRYDISLLRLRGNATITDFVRTICIPNAEMDSEFPAGTICTATGWGDTSEGGIGTKDLYEVDVSIIDEDLCGVQYAPSPITEEMLCAGDLDGGSGVCYRDSGGPLVSKLDDVWYLVGMPSWSRGCGDPGYPAVYTRITYFEDWIMGVIDGNYSAYECNKNFTEAPGAFTSPFYPANYPNDASCQTRITAPEGSFVYLSIRDFRLESDDTRCAFDSLSVYDSDHMDPERLIGVFCGANNPRFIASTGRNMFVYFKTDGSITDKGFDAAYYFVQDTGCNNEFTMAPGVFSSPDYPNEYSDNSQCTTLITAPPNRAVTLIVQDFRLEFDEEGCASNYDTLSIYDGSSTDAPLIGVYCHDVIPEMITSTSESLYIVFKSDDGISASGFEIAFYFLPEQMPTTSPSPQPGCGLQTVTLDPELSVVGGNPAQEGEWPWHVALLWNNIFVCNGVLFTTGWVATTAQCIKQDTSAYSVLLGTNSLYEFSNNVQRTDVSSVYIHPEYNDETHDFDIALLKLTSNVAITDHVRTVCAPTMDMESEFDVGTECIATGWGAEDGAQERLQEVALTIESDQSCVEESLPVVSDNMLCAGGSDGAGVCTGDDGGPLVSRLGNRWNLVGLTARTDSCGSKPEVFTKLTAFYDWLSPIFEGKDPATKPTEDPLEPIREDLEKAREESNLYMYFTYAFAGVIAVILLIILYTVWYYSKERRRLEKEMGATKTNLPDTEQGKTNEGYYSRADEN